MEAASGPRLARIGAFGPPRLDFKWVIIGTCVALTLYLGVVPLAFLLWQSFFTPQTADKAAQFTFGNYAEAYGSPETARLFWNSVQFAIGNLENGAQFPPGHLVEHQSTAQPIRVWYRTQDGVKVAIRLEDAT